MIAFPTASQVSSKNETTQPFPILADDTIYAEFAAPSWRSVVTLASVVPTVAVPTGGTVTVTITNVTQTRIIVPAVDIRTISSPASLALDTWLPMVLGAGVAVQVEPGDLIRVEVTTVGAAPAPDGTTKIPNAYVRMFVGFTPR